MISHLEEPWNRVDAKITNYYPPTSRFYEKIQAHEQQHKDDFDNGFDGYVFINANEFEQTVMGLTAPTLDELDDMFKVKFNEYLASEIEKTKSLLPVLEERAYAISDVIMPFYVGQGECGGLQ